MAREASNSGNGPMDRLKAEARSLAGALGDRAMASVRDKVEGATGRLTEYVEGGGGPGVMAALTGARNSPRASPRAGRCSAPGSLVSRRRSPACSARAARAAGAGSSS